MRHRPGTAKGVVFITAEDEHGEANLVVYAAIGTRDRRAMIGARLLVAEGRVERIDAHAEVPILHLVVRKLTDRSDLLNGLGAVEGAEGAWDRMPGRADEVRRPDTGSRQDAARMPPSRDFR